MIQIFIFGSTILLVITGILSNVHNLIRFLLTIIFSNVATLECGTVHLHRQLRINIIHSGKKNLPLSFMLSVKMAASVPDGLFGNRQSFLGSLLKKKERLHRVITHSYRASVPLKHLVKSFGENCKYMASALTTTRFKHLVSGSLCVSASLLKVSLIWFYSTIPLFSEWFH